MPVAGNKVGAMSVAAGKRSVMSGTVEAMVRIAPHKAKAEGTSAHIVLKTSYSNDVGQCGAGQVINDRVSRGTGRTSIYPSIILTRGRPFFQLYFHHRLLAMVEEASLVAVSW